VGGLAKRNPPLHSVEQHWSMIGGGTRSSIPNSRASASPCRGIVLFAAGLIFSNGVAIARDLECERETISMSVSPDNTWVALVQEGWCSDGGFVTISTDTVRLARRDSIDQIQLAPRDEKPLHENDVLVVDYYGHAENRPLIQWLSPQRLQITVPNLSGGGLQKSRYQGVDIVIKYEPDDPAAREKWQREHGPAPK
jgi:hypothetical protein